MAWRGIIGGAACLPVTLVVVCLSVIQQPGHVGILIIRRAGNVRTCCGRRLRSGWYCDAAPNIVAQSPNANRCGGYLGLL